MKKITTQFYILLIIVMSLNLKLVIASEYDEGEIKLDDGSIEMINSAISNYENYLNSVIQDTMTVVLRDIRILLFTSRTGYYLGCQ